MVIAFFPSTLAFLASSLTIFSTFFSCSSAESSIVTIRSSLGIKLDSTLRNVVLPLPVPPDINRLYFALTAFSRNAATSVLTEPSSINFSMVRGISKNLRTVIIGPFNATGGRIIHTLEPSASLVSTIGTEAFTILLDNAAIFWAISSSLASLSKTLPDFSIRPFLSINILSFPLIIISVIESSSSISCSTSSLLIALNTVSASSCLCLIGIMVIRLSSNTHSSITSISSLSSRSCDISSLPYTLSLIRETISLLLSCTCIPILFKHFSDISAHSTISALFPEIRLHVILPFRKPD